MELIKKISPSETAFAKAINLWQARPEGVNISDDPVLSAQHLNDNLLQSLIVSLHCATHDPNSSHQSFDGRAFRHDDIIIFASPLKSTGSHYNNNLFRISSRRFTERMLLPVFKWKEGCNFYEYPMSVGSLNFNDYSRNDANRCMHSFKLVKFNSHLFECKDSISRIDLLSALKSQFDALPCLMDESNYYSTGFIKLIDNTRTLLNNSASAVPKTIIWDRYWNMPDQLNSAD